MAAPSPDKIGLNSDVVRPAIQAFIDTFENDLADPIYAVNANKAKATDPAGTLVFQIVNRGYLNNTEITTFKEGWLNAGWTDVFCQNVLPTGSQGIDFKQWIFRVTYTP